MSATNSVKPALRVGLAGLGTVGGGTHAVEQQAVHFFDHRQHRFARHRSPATEDDRDFVLAEQLLGFFSEQRPVGGRVHDHGLELFAEHTALGVDFVNGHEHGVF